MHQKLVLDPFSGLVNNPKQPLHARNKNIRIFKNKVKEDYQKALKKLSPEKFFD